MEPMAPGKDRRVVYAVVTVILLLCLLQLPIFYDLTRGLSSFHTCNAITFVKSLSSNATIAPNITLTEQSHSLRNTTLGLQNLPKISLRGHGYANYPFVQFSAYRESTTTFYVVGITSVIVRHFDQPVHICEWHSSQNTSEITITKAEMVYVYYDQFPRLYVVVTVNCTFAQEVGMDDMGGSLMIAISVGPNRGDTEKSVAMVEQKGAAKEFLKKRDNPPPWEFAFCGPPMHGSIKAEWIVTWLVYHHYLFQSKVHFFFYNVGAMEDRHYNLLDPWLKSGHLTIINALDEHTFPSWYHNQLLLANDCLHRTRYLASWTFFHDLDEFLHIPTGLSSLLSQHPEAPYMTFANIRANTRLCAELAAGDWPVQRLVWMEKQPYCAEAKFDPWVCTHWQGARKYVANPRKVLAAAVHTAAIPDVGGWDVNGSVAWMYHFHGMLSTEVELCSERVNVSVTTGEELRERFREIQSYNLDFSLARAIAKAREVVPPHLQPSSSLCVHINSHQT